MIFVRCIVTLVAGAVALRKDEKQSPPPFPVIDWDKIEKHHKQKPIKFESKDFTLENPHVEQAILDEGKRDAEELDLDRNLFVKHMMEFRDEVAKEITSGTSKLNTQKEFVPRIKKIQLR